MDLELVPLSNAKIYRKENPMNARNRKTFFTEKYEKMSYLGKIINNEIPCYHMVKYIFEQKDISKYQRFA